MALKMISFRLSEKDIQKINKEVENSNFKSKSEFFRSLVNNYLKKSKKNDKKESN